MADIVITAAEVRLPAPGKKTGVVKDHTGKYWYVWPDKLGFFSQGATYRITDYRTSDFNGKTYYTITQFERAQGAAQPSQQTSRPPDAYDNAKRLDIFICGAFNNLMANPNIHPTEMTMVDMVDALQKFKGAWMGVFGPSPLSAQRPQQQGNSSQQYNGSVSSGPPQHQNNDMNDEIPF